MVLKILVWFAFFLLVATVNWEYRYQLPIWDTAGGLFAPAEYLYKSNFDLFSLLNEDGFSKGGPNVHVYSIVTFLTAFDMWFFDGDRDLVYFSLHALQFAISAYILYMVFYLSLPFLGPINALLVSITVFAFPPFLVQTRYMYMELAGAASLLFAYSSWVQGFYKKACVGAILACSIKSFGLALVAALAILIMFDRGRSLRFRVILVSIMVFPGLVFEALRWLNGNNMGSKMVNGFDHYFIHQFYARLIQTPDLLILMSLVLLGGVRYGFRNTSCWNTSLLNTKQAFDDSMVAERMLFGGVLILGSFLGFIVTVPLSGALFYPLTRYYIWIWPLVIPVLILLLFVLSSEKNQSSIKALPSSSRKTASFLVFLSIFFIANSSGKFYPGYQGGISSFSVVERSTEYEAFNKMQRYLLISASAKANAPVYLNIPDYYFTSSVLMGYLDKINVNFKNIVTSFDDSGDLAQYPDTFNLVYSNRGHGGFYMRKLVEEARRRPNYSVDLIDSCSLDGFDGYIYRITRRNTARS